MKKILFITLLLGGISARCTAQNDSNDKIVNNDSIPLALPSYKEPRLLFNIHNGYALGLGSTYRFYPDDISSIMLIKYDGTQEKFVSYSNPSKGLGEGYRFGAGLSYILNDFINIGMDIDYFKSTIQKVRDSTFRENLTAPGSGQPDDYKYEERTTISYDATLISLTPNITFKAISRPKWFIYNKLGAILTFRPNSLQEDMTDVKVHKARQGVVRDSASLSIKRYEWDIKKPSLGFMGAFGIQVKLAEKIRAFGELQFSHLVFLAKKRTVTEYTVDGADRLNTLSLNARQVNFVKSFTQDFSNYDPNRPSQSLVQRIPLSYIGLQVGLTFQLK
ncbi:MAG: hypothetical protein ABIN01_06415 [Ferruginibacter sp.]